MLEFQLTRQMEAAPDMSKAAANLEIWGLADGIQAKHMRGKYTLVIFPPEKMWIAADKAGINAKKFAYDNRERLAAVANGTYFQNEGGSFRATGVLVLGGKEAYPYQENGWKGVFGITSDGKPFIVENSAFRAQYGEKDYGKLRLAFAGGRILVSDGKINGKTGEEANGKKASERTVLGITDGGGLFLYCTSEKMTQAQVAEDILGNVSGVKAAINLDGGSSSQLYAPSKPGFEIGNASSLLLGFFRRLLPGDPASVHSVICVDF